MIEKFYKFNRILLGLIILIAGLMKLFVSGISATALELSAIGLPLSIFCAWALTLGEIISGLLILANRYIGYAGIVPITVMLTGAFTIYISDFYSMFTHLIAASAYLLITLNDWKGKRIPFTRIKL